MADGGRPSGGQQNALQILRARFGLGVCLKHRPGCQGRSCNTLPAKVGRVRGLPNLPAEAGKSTYGAITTTTTFDLVPAEVSSYGGWHPEFAQWWRGAVRAAAERTGPTASPQGMLWRTAGFLSVTLQRQNFQVLAGCAPSLAEQVDGRLGRPLSEEPEFWRAAPEERFCGGVMSLASRLHPVGVRRLLGSLRVT